MNLVKENCHESFSESDEARTFFGPNNQWVYNGRTL